MANELIFSGDPASQSGLTVTAKVYTTAGVQQGTDVSMTEVGSLAFYRGNMPSASAAAFLVRYFDGSTLLDQGWFAWDGTAEKIILDLNDLSAADVNAEVDTALADYDAPTKAEMDAGFAALNDPTAASIADAVWDESLAAHVGVGSTGEALNDTSTSAEIAALNDIAAADVWAVGTREITGGTITTNSDKTGYSISGTKTTLDALNDVSAADVADAVWDESLAAHLTAGSTGEALNNASAPTAAQVADAVWDEAQADHLTVGSMGAALNDKSTSAEITALNDLSAAQVNAEVDTALADYDAPTKAEMDAAFAALNDPTAASIADAVWDESLAAHLTAGSTGEALNNASAPTAAQVADAVWDEAQADHLTVGSMGAALNDKSTSAEITALNDLSAAQVNAEVDTALADYDAPTKAEMDAAFAALNDPTAASIADAVWDESLAAHVGVGSTGEALNDTSTSAEIAALNDLSAAQVNAEVDTALADYDAPTKAEMDAAFAALNDPTAAQIADAVWDETLADHLTVGSTGEALNAAGGGLTAAQIADAVWDEAQADHLTAGSMGASLNAKSTSAEISALNDLSAAQVNAEVDTALADYDAPTKAEMDAAFAALNDVSAADVADAVWDESLAAHLTAGSTGEALNNASAPTAAQVADAVWDEAQADHLTVGSMGASLNTAAGGGTVDANIVSVNGTGTTSVNDFKADVSALATSAEIAALNDPTAADVADAVWDEALATHLTAGSTGEALNDTSTSAEIATLNDIDAATVNAQVDIALADYDAPTKAEMDAAFAALNDVSAADVADAVWDESLAAHLTAGSTGEALNNASAPTAAQVADAVWDEAQADHLTVGSMGASLNTAAGGGTVDANIVSVNGTGTTSVNDFKADLTTVLTNIAAIPADVWTYTTRELTASGALTPTQAAQLAELHTIIATVDPLDSQNILEKTQDYAKIASIKAH